MAIAPREDEDVRVLQETRDTPPSDYLFKIKTFSLFPEHSFGKIKSSNFEAGGHQWRILFFPNGRDEGLGDHVSIYLSVASKKSLADGKRINAIFKFFVFDQIRAKYYTVQGGVRRFDRTKYRWGLSKFISLEDFKAPASGFLVNDTCFIGAEVYVIQSSSLGSSSICESLSMLHFDDIISFKYTWKLTGFSGLVDECYYSDEFVVGNYKWRLKCYPRGDGDNRGCNLSMFLELVDSPIDSPAEKVKAYFQITLHNQIDKQDHANIATHWFGASAGSIQGWDSFIRLKDLKKRSFGFLVDDCCVFEAKVNLLCATYQESLNP